MNVAPATRHKARAAIRRRLSLPDVKPLETDPMRPGYRRDSKRGAWAMLSFIASFALAASAIPTEAFEAGAIEGRWKTLDDRAALDITRCGQDYCGQRVKLQDQTSPACGRTVLRIKFALSDIGAPTFEGKLDLDDGAGPYPVALDLSEYAKTMTILGQKEQTPIWSRSIPMRISLARGGDAVCMPPIS